MNERPGGGSTNLLNERMAFLNGGFSFIIPSSKGTELFH